MNDQEGGLLGSLTVSSSDFCMSLPNVIAFHPSLHGGISIEFYEKLPCTGNPFPVKVQVVIMKSQSETLIIFLDLRLPSFSTHTDISKVPGIGQVSSVCRIEIDADRPVDNINWWSISGGSAWWILPELEEEAVNE